MTAALLDPKPWESESACRNADGDEFFTHDGEDNGTAMLRAQEIAVKYCKRCPVIKECGKDGDEGRHVGLWGGVWRERMDAGDMKKTNLLGDLSVLSARIVSADAVRGHVRGLLAGGMSRKMIAAASGVHVDKIGAIAAGRIVRVKMETAEKLKAVGLAA